MFLKGYKQTPEQIQKRVETTAKAKEAWAEERRNLFKSRVSESAKGRIPWNKGRTGCMAIPWNKGTIGCMPPAWNKGTKKHTPEEERAMEAARARNRRERNVKQRLNESMSSMVYIALKEKKNGHKWEDLVGYTCEDLMTHLEGQFKEGMSWDNKGQWHIDHITPRSKFHFDSYNDIEFKECWSLSNLQPLWSEENLRKATKTYNSQIQLLKI